jgi:hypothetical protein
MAAKTFYLCESREVLSAHPRWYAVGNDRKIGALVKAERACTQDCHHIPKVCFSKNCTQMDVSA